MPRQIDTRPLPFDRDPLKQLDLSVPKLELPPIGSILFKQIGDQIWNLIEPIAQALGLAGAQAMQDFFKAFMGVNFAEPHWFERILGNAFGMPEGPVTWDTLNAFLTVQLFGVIAPGRISSVSIAALTDSQPNLVQAGSFKSAGTIQDVSPVWGFSEISRSGDEGGSIRCLANGQFNAVVSNRIECTPGQQVYVEGFARWAGLVATGPAVRLEVKTYAGQMPLGSQVVKALASTPGAASTSYSGNEGGWVKLSGDWVVPASVTAYRVRLVVTEQATAGEVNFDDIVSHQTGQIQQEWVTNLVSDLTDARARNQAVIDRIWNGFANGEMIDGEHPVESVLESIAGLLGIGLNASASVTTLGARVRALESAANTIVEDFGVPASNIPPTGWVVNYTGPGAGSIGTDGKGNAVWRPNGVSNYIGIARYITTPLTVDNGVISVVLATSPQSPLFDDAFTYLCCRINSSGSTYTRLRIGYGEIRLQAVVNNAITNLTSSLPVSCQAGDQVDFHFGFEGTARRFVVKRNAVKVMDVTDSSETAVVGFTNRYQGFGMETGNRLLLFQNIPAGLSVFTAAEVP